MFIKPSQVVTVRFTVNPSTGIADADSLPAGTVSKNGADDGTVTVTVTDRGVGRYSAAFTVPASGYVAGDFVALEMAATVGALNWAQAWNFQVDTSRASDVATTIGAAGAGLTALGDARLANLDAAISTRATPAQVNTEADTALSDVGLTTTITGRIDVAISSRLASGSYTTPPTVGAIADQVWDEALAGHATAGTAGAALTTAGAAADPLLNTVPGSYAAGTAGHAIGRIGSGQINTRSTVAQGGNIEEIIGGATYAAADGLSFDWTDANDSWPTLTSATVVWHAMFGGTSYTKTGSVVTATGSSKKVRLELTATETAALQAIGTGIWTFMVWATLSGGSVVALVGGTARVKNPPGPS